MVNVLYSYSYTSVSCDKKYYWCTFVYIKIYCLVNQKIITFFVFVFLSLTKNNKVSKSIQINNQHVRNWSLSILLKLYLFVMGILAIFIILIYLNFRLLDTDFYICKKNFFILSYLIYFFFCPLFEVFLINQKPLQSLGEFILSFILCYIHRKYCWT